MNSSIPARNLGSCFPGKCLVKFLLLVSLGVLGATTPATAGILYGATSSSIPGEFYILDPATGAVIQDVGPLNDSSAVNYPITGLAFHPVSGVLYGSTGNFVPATAAMLVTINPNTGL